MSRNIHSIMVIFVKNIGCFSKLKIIGLDQDFLNNTFKAVIFINLVLPLLQRLLRLALRVYAYFLALGEPKKATHPLFLPFLLR